MNVEITYQRRFARTLQKAATAIERELSEHLSSAPRVDRISARAKSVSRFVAKSEKRIGNTLRYNDPLNQIQDQIGARVITFYNQDVASISEIIERYYRPVETRLLVPESEWEFGYVGKHYVLFITNDVRSGLRQSDLPEFFELQIKTLFQHAWSEANHDLGYKPGDAPLSPDAKRTLAFAAAQSWGADRMFGELFAERSVSVDPDGPSMRSG